MRRRQEWGHWASYGHCLGENLRQLRTMRGLSQDRLAELAGVSRNQISNIERNENSSRRSADPVLSTLYRLARALHVPPAALLPASDQLVDEICPGEGPGVDIHWPAHPEDTMAFDAHHLYNASPENRPRFRRSRAGEVGVPLLPPSSPGDGSLPLGRGGTSGEQGE